MLNSKNYFGTDICRKCHSKSNKCSCNSLSSKKKSKSKTKKSKPNHYEDDSNIGETFPPLSSDISNKPEIKEMEVLSNLDNVRDLEFSHKFIAHQIDKFAITPILCNNCNDLSKHLLDPAYYTNELYVKNSKWILNSDSKLTMEISPYKDLTIPIFDISNINISHPENRPRGKIHLCRELSDIIRKEHFVHAARVSSLSALKRLKDKPYMCAELAHKLAEDVDQKVLIKLDDYLELPEVKRAGITRETAHANIVPSAIH